MDAPEPRAAVLDVLIVDDEPLARQRLQDLLADLPNVRVVGEVGDGRQAVDACAQLCPDVVLLDIAMPVMDGLEAARHLASDPTAPAVVFCTAYDEHALAAFEARAIDYLLKPVRAERLAAALERARSLGRARANERLQALPKTQARTHLCARLRGSLRLIPVADVVYLQAEEKYVVVHHLGGQDLIEDSLKALEQEFPERFLRIHRNCLVARSELRELRRGNDGQVHALLKRSADALEISRRCLPQIRQLLKHL
ncbi:MAG: response regulator transcription factor [Xanthomonadales bacterium]|nr:response regulator transcription factor [Xanthomonadales bacterium]